MENSEVENIEQPRQPRTKTGRNVLEKRKPQLQEGPRNTLFIRGPKSSESVRLFMNQFYQLKKNFSLLFNRKHDVRPFEDQTQLEKYCEQNDCSQFCYVSNSQKRPNNVIIGRIFNGKVLDMVELGIVEYISQEQIGQKFVIPYNSRPTIIFQGEVFGYHKTFIKIQNIFTDFFFENVKTDAIKSDNQINLVIYINADENSFSLTLLQRYSITKDGIAVMKTEEIGPQVKFEVRREKYADDDTFKKACKQPVFKKKAHEKNIKYSSTGDRQGRVFVQQQDLGTIALKKRRKIRKVQEKVKKSVKGQENAIEDQQ